jgi:hypothetical protein
MFHTRGIIGRSYWTIAAASGCLSQKRTTSMSVGIRRSGTPATPYIISVYGVMSIMPQIVVRNGLFLVWGVVLSRGVVYGMLLQCLPLYHPSVLFSTHLSN